MDTIGVRSIKVMEDNYSTHKVFGVFEVTGTYANSLVFFKIGEEYTNVENLQIMAFSEHILWGCQFE